MGKRTRSRRTSQRTTSFGSLLRATPNHVDHGKMARFFGSMAGRAAGMRKALFTNGPGIKTLASAGVGCVGLQLNFGTHALAQSRTEPKELKTRFSYDGWKRDAEIAEERDIKYPEHPICAWAILDTMLRKQQVHDGDRSHPFIRKLDALTPTLSYAGWEGDARNIEWPRATWALDALALDTNIHLMFISMFISRFISMWLIYEMNKKDVDSALALMRRKQAQHDTATESSDAKQRRLNDIVIRLE